MIKGTTFGTITRSRCAVAAAAAVVAVAATVVLPGAAHAAYRHRAESAFDTTSPKSVTATCGADEVLIGAGGRIRNGNGGVRLAAMVPGATSVVVRGEAYPDHAAPWSVIAAAICESDDGGTRVVQVSPAGSRTASCPADLVLSGTGFDLPAGVPLAGLVPDADGASVTVRTALTLIGTSPVAYAVCVDGNRASWGGVGVRYKRFAATSPVGTSSPRTVTVQSEWEWEVPSLSGVGGEVTVLPGPADPFPIARSDIFIDTMMPNDDGTRATVTAVQRAATGAGRSADGGAPAGASAAGDELLSVPRYLTHDDTMWTVTGYSTDHDIY